MFLLNFYKKIFKTPTNKTNNISKLDMQNIQLLNTLFYPLNKSCEKYNPTTPQLKLQLKLQLKSPATTTNSSWTWKYMDEWMTTYYLFTISCFWISILQVVDIK
jgi:hypothetical protein